MAGLSVGQAAFRIRLFHRMIECAFTLIKKGKAYVCDLSAEEIREYRGTLTEPERRVLTGTVPRKTSCSSRK